MKLLALCAATILQFGKKKETLFTRELLQRVQQKCREAVGWGMGDKEIAYENLCDAVVDKLMADDCRRVQEAMDRNEEGKVTDALLNSVVKTSSIDLFRKANGRSDWAHLDGLPKLICRLHYTFRYPAAEVTRLVSEYCGNEITLDEVCRVIEANARKSSHDPNAIGDVVMHYDEDTMIADFEVVDRRTAETVNDMFDNEQHEEKTIDLFLMRLSPENRLLISLFFGLDGNRLKLKEIAAMEPFKCEEHALQNRKDRAIREFREWLAKQKLSLDELIVRQALRSAS